MKIYDEFVYALNSQPEKLYDSTYVTNKTQSPLSKSQSQLLRETYKSEMIEKLEETRVFLFSPDMISGSTESDAILDTHAAPPFKTCWFQFMETPEDVAYIKYYDGTRVFALWIHEKAPGQYLFCLLTDDGEDEDMIRYRFGETNGFNSEIGQMIAVWLQPFSQGYTGASKKVSDRIRFRHPKTKEKRLHKIRRVVMVYPKNLNSSVRSQAEREGVEFSHRFEVRAHWRKLYFKDQRVDEKGNKMIDHTRVGKNREGVYECFGYTFVSESVKGPDHLPVINKTRIVKEES